MKETTEREGRRESEAPRSRVVRNRDIPVLARVIYEMQDVTSLERRCQWQRERMFHITQRITGMPSAHGMPSGFDSTLAALDGLNEEYRAQIASYVREIRAAERIMSGIASVTMRAFVRMLYVDNMPPEQVRRGLNLSEWGFRRARDCVEQARDMASVVWREKYVLEEENAANPQKPLDSQGETC